MQYPSADLLGLRDEIELRVEGPCAFVVLSRPAKLNALTWAMLQRLEAIACACERSDELRAVILTGAGKAFCAGADIDEWSRLEPRAFGREWIGEGHRIFDRWARLPQPVIAALNGVALGGGLELAATADLRLAEAHVRVGLPETRVGVIPGWSGTQRLVRRVGPSGVKRLIFTGEPIEAEEALRLGILDMVCPTGSSLERASALAATIVQRAPLALQMAKQLVNAAEGEAPLAPLLEGFAGILAAASDDGREGVASFKEKRSPLFRNR